MHAASITQGGIILVQLIVGSLGNLTVLLCFIYLGYAEHALKPVHLIVSHLAIVNMMSLLFRTIPHAMSFFEVKEILTSAGCKSLIYLYRVTHALSVTTTCTLSVLQSTTIAPMTSWWGKQKQKCLHFLVHSFVILWILNLVVYCHIPLATAAPENNTIPLYAIDMRFCYAVLLNIHSKAIDIVTQMFYIVIDLIPVLVMIMASGYILLILKRHKQQVHYIQSSRKNATKAAEVQASHTIIQLVTVYAFFYGIDIVLMMYITMTKKQSFVLSDVRTILSYCYPFLSPFIMIRFNKKASFLLTCGRKKIMPYEKYPPVITLVTI